MILDNVFHVGDYYWNINTLLSVIFIQNNKLAISISCLNLIATNNIYIYLNHTHTYIHTKISAKRIVS